MLKNQKGITLIALIITIIVMLILVGVTINVALNGGLFEKGEKAAFQTEASIVKEQLEMAKALKVMDSEGKPVDDYSDILVGNLEGLDGKTQNKYANIIVVAKNGDICYNPATVTSKQKSWLEEIGIRAYVNTSGSEPTITYGEKYVLAGNSDVYIIFLEDGATDGTATSGMTIIYRLNGTTLQASINGAEYMDFGFFNEDFTRFETIENDISDGGQIFELKETSIEDEPETPVEEAKDRVYGPLTVGGIYYILTANNELVVVSNGQIAGQKPVEIYYGTTTELISDYPKYAEYEIEEEIEQYKIFIILEGSVEGVLNEREDRVYLVGESDANNDSIMMLDISTIYGDLNPNLSLEDIVQ